MAVRVGDWSRLAITAALSCQVALGEGGAGAADAYVTIAHREEVYRLSPGVPKPSQIGAIFSTENNRISPGESVRTGATSAAMLVIPATTPSSISNRRANSVWLNRPPPNAAWGSTLWLFRGGRPSYVVAVPPAGWLSRARRRSPQRRRSP